MDRPNQQSQDGGATRVLVLYVGGTIGMVLSSPGNSASPLIPGASDHILRWAAEIGVASKINWDLHVLAEPTGPVDSSDVTPEHWLQMASIIESEYSKWDGFVILHGTDTMAYTASALSFLFNNLGKPVVLTGSQIPITEDRTDGHFNFANSLRLAGYKATGLPLIPEVIICFGDSVLRGNRAIKWSASELNGFRSPNFPRLGTLGERIRIERGLIRKPIDNDAHPFSVNRVISRRIVEITVSPGLRANWLERALSSNSGGPVVVDGAVLRTFGAGNVPLDPEFLAVLRAAIHDGSKTVVNVTQCPQGMVSMGLYAGGAALMDAGVVSGIDMTAEAAFAKVSCMLPQFDSPAELRRELQVNQRGEQSLSLFELDYGSAGSLSSPIREKIAAALVDARCQHGTVVRGVVRICELQMVESASREDIAELAIWTTTAQGESPRTTVSLGRCTTRSPVTLVAEVTSAIIDQANAGQRIDISVSCRNNSAFCYRNLYINLFAHV